MDVEFHYYVTYIVAKRAGFSKDDAYLIAYSSQYVDDNNVIFCVNKSKADEYSNYISQTLDITRPKNELMRIYPLFHFIPGNPFDDSAKRRDGCMHLLNTTANSKISNMLIDEALSISPINPYRIGIATHSYMDTWAHQNFIGFYEHFNAMSGARELLTPNIGHADALHDPDIPGLIWKDRRLIKTGRVISNKRRFLEASENVFGKYLKSLDRNIKKNTVRHEWERLKKVLDEAVGQEYAESETGKKDRIKRYRAVAAGIGEYRADAWFKKAVKTKIKGLPDVQKKGIRGIIKLFPDEHIWRKDYKKSHWYKFQESVKEHQHFAESLCRDLFEQMEIENY